MSTTSTFRHINENLGLFAFVPEVTQDSPNYSFTASGGTTTTVTINAAAVTTHDIRLATMADDFFNGLQIYWRTGANAGSVFDITDSSRSTTTVTLTFATTTTAPVSTETFYLLGPLQASDVSIDTGPENLDRDFVRLSLDPPSSKKGLRLASGSFKFEFLGLATPATSSSAGGLDRLSQFLKCIGDRSAKSGDAVEASPTPTTTAFEVSTGANFAAGDHILIEGQMRRITSVVGDLVTLDFALSAAPTAAAVVYHGEVFTPKDLDHQTHTILALTDDRLIEIPGAVFNIKISVDSFGSAVMGEAEWDAAGFTFTDGNTIDGSQLSKCSIVFKTTGNMYYGSTELGVNSFEFDLGHGRQELRDTSAGQHFDIRTRAATAGLVFRDIALTPKESWEISGTQDNLLVGFGNTAGDAGAVVGNAQIQALPHTNNNDTRYWDSTYQFVDDQTTSSATPLKPLVIRF